jgi:hypothetical protein
MIEMNHILNSKMIKLSLRFWGEQLNPQTVSDNLGLKPSYSYKKGHTKQLSSGKTTAPKELGIWVFEKQVMTSFEDELDILLNKIKCKNLKSIDGVDLIILDLYFGLSDNDSQLDSSYECRIDEGALLKLAELGLDVRITIS